MKLKNGLLTTTVIAAVFSLVPITGARASSSASTSLAPDCAPASICGWSGYNYTGQKILLQAGAGCIKTPFPLRSIANTYGSPGIPAAAAVYATTDCTGPILTSVGQEQRRPVVSPPGLSVYLVW